MKLIAVIIHVSFFKIFKVYVTVETLVISKKPPNSTRLDYNSIMTPINQKSYQVPDKINEKIIKIPRFDTEFQ